MAEIITSYKKSSQLKKVRKKKKRKKLIPLPRLLKKTQVAFNKYIRERDKDNGCISCGGKVTQAGHYVAQGSSSFLRFNTDNVNGQCAGCNTFKHGNLIKYRLRLVKKIGEERVKYLENSMGTIKKWKRWELEDLLKELNET